MWLIIRMPLTGTPRSRSKVICCRVRAVRADADLIDPAVQGRLEMALDARESGHRQHAEPCVAQLGLGRPQHLRVAQRGDADLEGGRADTVAMPDLKHVDPGALGGLGIGANVLGPELVADGMVAVPERRITDRHTVAPLLHRQCPIARASASAIPAQVMMSRFPA
jgi:hypothetical protein